jgi:hypothetical protein
MRLKTTDMGEKTLAQKIQTTYAAKIDKNAVNMVMDMLSKLYNDPMNAAIREYVSNAYDANVEAGATKPVELTLPCTENDGLLMVKDYGRGLDYMGIVSVFANFGTSTKRDSDNLIGGFGIGSKSGLAVSNAINVSSVCNGTLNEFVLERTPEGIVTRFTKENEPCTQDSGTTVTVNCSSSYYSGIKYIVTNFIPVIAGWSKNDVYVTNTSCSEFNTSDDDFFLNDKCNNYRIPDTWLEFDHGYITSKPFFTHFRNILIGNVAYKQGSLDNNNGHPTTNDIGCAYALKTNIEDIKVTYSREQIDWKSNSETEDALIAATDAFTKEVEDFVHDLIDSSSDAIDAMKKCIKANIDPNDINYKKVNTERSELPWRFNEYVDDSNEYKKSRNRAYNTTYTQLGMAQTYDNDFDIVITTAKDTLNSKKPSMVSKILAYAFSPDSDLPDDIKPVVDKTIDDYIVNTVAISAKEARNNVSVYPTHILLATAEAQLELPYSWGIPNLDFEMLERAYKEYMQEQRKLYNQNRTKTTTDVMQEKAHYVTDFSSHVWQDSLEDIKDANYKNIVVLEKPTHYSLDDSHKVSAKAKLIACENDEAAPVVIWGKTKKKIKTILDNIPNAKLVTDEELDNAYAAIVEKYKSTTDTDVQVFMKFVDSIKTKDKLINYTYIHKQFGLDENYYEKVPKALRVNTIIDVPYYQNKETMDEYVNNMSDNAKLLVMIANNNDFQFETKHVQDLIDKVKPEFQPIAEKINNLYKDWL